MPILHGVSPSPFVRKIRIVLAEKAIEYEFESVMPGAGSASFEKISPLRKVPVYQEGDFALPDSSVIFAYLERTHPVPRLLSEDARELGRALWFEEYADTKLVDVVMPVFIQRVLNTKIFKQSCDEALVERSLESLIPPVFGYLESQIREDQWLVGDVFSIADIAVGSVFVSLKLAGEAVDGSRWPGLASYVERTHARASIAAIIAEEEASFDAL